MNTDEDNLLSVTFWGVRGTLAAPGRDFQRTGGNTICAEVRCGNRIVVLDAGTGIRELGSRLIEQSAIRRIDLFFTHGHYDHVEGLPFFAPFFSPEFEINVWAGHLDGSKSTEDTVKGLMRRPYFPVGPEVFSARVAYREVERSKTLDLGDGVVVRTAPLNHPGGATGYRIDYRGRSFAFITDTEHVPGKIDRNVAKLIQDVDLFAYDASFTDAELPDFAGYGHSTWEEGLRLRKVANAGAMLAMHHMPFRMDADIDALEKSIQRSHAASGVAREGMTIKLAGLAKAG
ncbi:MAG TPA: MBL fold metallo-hydrolase [Rhizobiaceae bacterium]|nr:MBL fold metallo-hydrolase [Rhizobiaceae bacterium]